jgi:hypothetical protein
LELSRSMQWFSIIAFAWAEQHMAWSAVGGEGKLEPDMTSRAVTRNRRGARWQLGEAEAMAKGARKGSIGKGEGT